MQVLVGAMATTIWANATEQTYPTIVVEETHVPFRQFNKVEITGSSIIRKEQTQSLPVQVITRAEIVNSGKHDVAEVLQALPVMANFTSGLDIAMTNGGTYGAAVHGMQSYTLVLINGRRIAPYGRQAIFQANDFGSEINLLPLSAVDRIEILTDGASSVYGTDALAGVVNIITRNERPGVEITAEQRVPDRQKGQGSRVDVSVGGGKLQSDGYSWFIAADLQHQQQLMGADRPYAAQGQRTINQDGQTYWVRDPQITAAQSTTTLASSIDSPTKLWSANYQNGTCPNGNVPVPSQQACNYSPMWQNGLYPQVDAVRLHAQGQWALSADHLLFTEYGFQQSRQVRASRPWGTYTAQIANQPDAPGYALAVAHGLDPAKGAWLLYSGSDLGLGTRQYDMQTHRFVSGLKGQWADWDYRSAVYFSSNQASYGSQRFMDYPNLGVDAEGFLINPALLAPLSSGTVASETLLTQLRGTQYWNDTDTGRTRLQGVEVHASRAIGELNGKDVLLALGSDFHQEHDQYHTFMPALTQPDFEGRRSVWAQYAELQAAPLPEVETLVALRNDRYSDFGNTTHAKLSVKWAPAEQWLLRAAMGSGFRAPTISQLQNSAPAAGSTAFSLCTPALQGIADRLHTSCSSDNTYLIYSQGNPNLKPELSKQQSVGVRYSFNRNHSLWLDYWRINVRNRISELAGETILADPQAFAQYFEKNDQNQLQLHTSLVNLGQTRKSGVDFGWALRVPTDVGQLHARVSGTLALKSAYTLTDNGSFINDLNTLSGYSGYVTPRLRMQMTLGLNQPGWTWLGTVNYVGSYDDGGFTGVNAQTGEDATVSHHRVPAWWTLDLAVRHEISRQWQVMFGVENILNREAPLSFGTYNPLLFGTNPMYASLWGRTVNLAATYRF